jgi:hypothetical protein
VTAPGEAVVQGARWTVNGAAGRPGNLLAGEWGGRVGLARASD